MKMPSFMSPYFDGNSPTRLLQGLFVGVFATLIVGFTWGGWHLNSTVEEMVESASRTSMVEALAPICADKFERAAKADDGLVNGLAAVDSWRRDRHLVKAGWATFPGGAEPDNNVAAACAKLLNKALKLK